MFCTKCGEKVPLLSKFCTKCGHKVSKTDAAPKGEGKPRRFRALKILGIGAGVLAVLIIISAIGYILTGYGPATYKHPAAGFTFTYYKSLKVETPALPSTAKCDKAAPCLVVLKNPAYNDYAVNWFIVISAADAGVDKETFIAAAGKGFKTDVDAGLATTMMVGDKKIYKFESDSNQPSDTIAVFSKMMGFDPSLQKTMYAFTSGDSVVAIFFTKPPPGAPGIYTNYLNISSLIIP